jgi:hypothetical protein
MGTNRHGVLPPQLVPLEETGWVRAAEAKHMRADDPIIVFTPKEQSYALPWWVLKNHHIANLVIDEQPIAVTLCERCSSAMAFDGRVDGERRTFQVIGTYRGTHVLADHETESIWTSFMGECIWGFHLGARLEDLRILQISWGAWAKKHPDSLVADGNGESREGHGSTRWPGSLEDPLGDFRDLDPRLPQNHLVLGVEVGDAARAYPLDTLIRRFVVNDDVGGLDVVVFGGQSEYTGVAFQRRLDDRLLRFVQRNGVPQDEETGSTWDLTGLALSGPLAGSRLRHVRSLVEEWYEWAAYHPQTDIYEA